MKDKIYQSMIELTNGKWSSTLLKHFAHSKISKMVIPFYMKHFNITTNDMICHVDDYACLHEFFIREINKENRKIDPAIESITSPVDATVEIFGDITEEGLFLVKGKTYTLANILGSETIGRQYTNGKYIILYLSPAEYHRIHAPVDGKIKRQYIQGNKSYPVNKWGLQYGKETISGNYRLLTELEMPNGRNCFHIKVGAMFINSIELTCLDKQWKKGQEVGYFSFGSTVVLLFEEGSVCFAGDLVPGKFVRMGEKIANML